MRIAHGDPDHERARGRAGSGAGCGRGLLARRRKRGRRGRSRGPPARGRPLLQRRARQRADRAGPRRARRRDHGRPQPPRGRGRGAQDDARADQPRAAADGAWPACLPVRTTAPTISPREPGSNRSTNDFFILPERRRQLDELLAAGKAASTPSQIRHRSARSRSTMHGHVAAATSTGGLTAKRWGRVGDSPLIGAGTYADDRSAAVSATGSGEYFIRAVAAHQLAERVRLGGEPLQAALDAVLADIAALGGKGGLIAVAPTATPPGASPRRPCTAAWPTPAADGRDLRRRGRAIGQVLAAATRFRWPPLRVQRRRTPPPRCESSGWE